MLYSPTNANIFYRTAGLLFFLIFFSFAPAQQATKGTLKGTIVDKKSKDSLEFVTVALHSIPDSTLLTGVITGQDGAFVFNEMNGGKYFLQISFLGFEPIRTSTYFLDSGQVKDLGAIDIEPAGKQLDEVQVSGEKSLYESAIDKKIYNVDKDMMSSSGSASEILGNIPSVSVDMDGVVSLRGSGNVTILINGKLSPLMKVNSASALQAIPANTIERIEIITNPSAKYKVNGTAGIINIVLKKNIKPGANGTVTANASVDDRYNSTIVFNYKPGKFNFYGAYGFRQDSRYWNSTDDRIVFDSIQSVYKQISSAKYRPQSHSANAGIDYSIDSNNTVGVSVQYFYQSLQRAEENSMMISESNTTVSDYRRDLSGFEYEWDKELTATFEHNFKKEDHTLSCEINLADHYENENNQYTQTTRIPFDSLEYDNRIISQVEKSVDLAVEYVYPIDEDSEFETGYNWESFGQVFDFYGEVFDRTLNVFVKDNISSNKFSFKQNVHALYATYSREIEEFSFLAGLRGEQAYVTSRLLTFDSVVPNNYFRLYPTLHLAYELGDFSELTLNYSRRISRPEGDELNPFPDYTNPRNLWAGNPAIKPEQTHVVELGYSLKNKRITFLPTFYYKYLYDGFTEISRYIDDSTLYTSFANLATEQQAGLELVLIGKVKKWMTFNFSGNVYYNEIDASNLGYSRNKSTVSYSAKLSSNFILGKTTAFQINTNYRSSTLSAQGTYLPVFILNFGVKQELFKKRASLLLTVSDAFNTLRSVSEINTPGLYQQVSGKRKSQIVYLGFSYRFGNSFKKSEELKFDEKAQ